MGSLSEEEKALYQLLGNFGVDSIIIGELKNALSGVDGVDGDDDDNKSRRRRRTKILSNAAGPLASPRPEGFATRDEG